MPLLLNYLVALLLSVLIEDIMHMRVETAYLCLFIISGICIYLYYDLNRIKMIIIIILHVDALFFIILLNCTCLNEDSLIE